jgi:isocitrate lyase
METGKPDLEQALKFAEAVHKAHPGKLLAYNCSPSFNWKKNLDDATIAKFQRELGAMGYKFQFITLAGFHQLNYGMFELARGYKDRQMAAYSELQEAEFAAEINGYTRSPSRCARWPDRASASRPASGARTSTQSAPQSCRRMAARYMP